MGSMKQLVCDEPSISSAITRIVDASREEFDAIGLTAARVDSIAQRARVSRQTVYYYYKTKEDLYRDILNMECRATIAELMRFDFNDPSPRRAIHKFLAEIVGHMERAPLLSSFFLEEGRYAVEYGAALSVFRIKMQAVVEKFQVLLDSSARLGLSRPGVDARRLFASACLLIAAVRTSGGCFEAVSGVNVSTPDGREAWGNYVVNLLFQLICPDESVGFAGVVR